jgi:hypothetical protein
VRKLKAQSCQVPEANKRRPFPIPGQLPETQEELNKESAIDTPRRESRLAAGQARRRRGEHGSALWAEHGGGRAAELSLARRQQDLSSLVADLVGREKETGAKNAPVIRGSQMVILHCPFSYLLL